MALLHYENLGVHRPDVLLRLAFHGLRDFYEYLKRTRDHMESEEVVLRLAWAPAEAPDDFEGDATGVWVELVEPEDRPNEPDRTFDAFLDEDVTEVYEVDRPAPAGNGRPRRVVTNQENRLEVRDRDPKTNRLLLDREPELPQFVLRPNTTTLRRQLAAVQQLQDAPAPAHLPLLRLFEQVSHADWPAVPDEDQITIDWQVLTDPGRPGTAEQREFVAVALQTPDFAMLEGPPGSGKTTAICELVLQLVARKKRVLLCASTHVAVDNVLERLGPLALRDDSELVPVRVGDRRKVSKKARPFQLEELVHTERQRLLTFLRSRSPRNAAQEELYRTLSGGSTAIERMVLDAANLVCGTTTGILRHPDIGSADASARAGMFDMLILDEASKTTFQEFLVPALLAKRWVIVGDPRQLSPFVEDAAVAANLRAALQDEGTRNACVDVFLAGHGDPGHRRAAVIVSDSADDSAKYARQAEARQVVVAEPDHPELALAQIVIGRYGTLAACDGDLPLDVGTVRGPAPNELQRRAAAYRRSIDVRDTDPPAWETELGWRLCRHYEQRQARDSRTADKLWTDIEALLPVEEKGDVRNGAFERIDRVRRVAFPSILESLQKGFERRPGQREGTALSDGLPEDVFAERHVLLEYQHRMHPQISAVPREKVYGGTALKDPADMERKRHWTYPGYQRRAVWLHVEGRFERARNRNIDEVRAILEELDRFRQWARANPKPDSPDDPSWEVAILTFYRGQERAMREALQRYAGAPRAYRHFDLGTKSRVDLRVELCTVDRFQGHEADLVFLSIANPRPTNFLESINRLNVAITRPRYQRVIVGHRLRLQRRPGSLLHDLAVHEPWEHAFGGAR